MSEPRHASAAATAGDTRLRAVVEGVAPEIDGGLFPIKRVVGDRVVVEADCFADGHDTVRAVLLDRPHGESAWRESPMEPVGNDRWRGNFVVPRLGRHEYTILAWVDHFLTWRTELERRRDADDLRIAARVGAGLLREAAGRAVGADADAAQLRAHADELEALDDPATARERGLDPALRDLARRHPDRTHAVRYPRVLEVIVDPVLARFGAWYEFFPRSFGADGRHGTLAECREMLDYAHELGFDIVYLPPIHPIGRTKRKGPNNTLHAGADDPGSPWAIGASEGGHKSVAPALGTLDDLRALVDEARARRIELALDIAFQCSPDHPYAREHPDWFRLRPDGTIQYAENPPKKYQDIYPFDFEAAGWRTLRDELEGVVRFWLEQGVRVFRVDNPHTKPFAFWEWVIGRIKATHPEVILLSEAFTRPRVMQRLAKVGFTQSYTYFTWRNTKRELESYFTELTRTQSAEYFRPNVWPNTPDILPEYLQHGGRPAFMARLVLAATLCSTYGIYGPAFELTEDRPREPGSEEYLDSEKYQLRRWDLERRDSLAGFIRRVNQIRRENAALHSNESLRFYGIDNDALIAYGKSTSDGENTIVTVVNLDPYHRQSGWLELPLEALGIDPACPFLADDLLTGAAWHWQGARNYVELDPNGAMAHIFRIRRRLRTERDFDYFM